MVSLVLEGKERVRATEGKMDDDVLKMVGLSTLSTPQLRKEVKQDERRKEGRKAAGDARASRDAYICGVSIPTKKILLYLLSSLSLCFHDYVPCASICLSLVL